MPSLLISLFEARVMPSTCLSARVACCAVSSFNCSTRRDGSSGSGSTCLFIWSMLICMQGRAEVRLESRRARGKVGGKTQACTEAIRGVPQWSNGDFMVTHLGDFPEVVLELVDQLLLQVVVDTTDVVQV